LTIGLRNQSSVARNRKVDDAGLVLPPRLSSQALAAFVLTTMESGVMLSRSHRTLASFHDAAAAAG